MSLIYYFRNGNFTVYAVLVWHWSLKDQPGKIIYYNRMINDRLSETGFAVTQQQELTADSFADLYTIFILSTITTTMRYYLINNMLNFMSK